jgi:hypothetical protein
MTEGNIEKKTIVLVYYSGRGEGAPATGWYVKDDLGEDGPYQSVEQAAVEAADRWEPPTTKEEG